MQIPIQNIYYLLCYAWNKLEEKETVDVAGIDSTELVDLFAKVLANGSSRLIRQGLDRYYIEVEELVTGVKGKLNFSETVKSNQLAMGKTYCEFDEFDYDILHNQILKTTIHKLLRTKNLNEEIKIELHNVYTKLPPISEIPIRTSSFNQIRLHRNNYHYDFLLKICRIVHESLLIDESEGKYRFMDFTREEKAMAMLFEEFVRNFFKLETDYKVKADQILWKLDPEDQDSFEMLPVMKTDITLKNEKRKIIIDTKYYKDALKGQYSPKISSNNLYQIFSYLINQEDGTDLTMNCEGILLYPSVKNEFGYHYTYKNHRIRIISINLDQEWTGIYSDLLEILNN